jgi:hypothetical protein
MEARPSRQRATNVCGSCRQRKVRCDGLPAPCGHCERLGLPCHYDASSGRVNSHRRLRAKRACDPCRTLKARCDGDLPICQRCHQYGRTCDYTLRRSARRSGSATESTLPLVGMSSAKPHPRPFDMNDPHPEAGRTTAWTELVSQAIDAYFQFFYRIPVFAFLHHATVADAHRRGTLDEALALALIGITTSVKRLANVTDEHTTYVNRAESIILRNLENPTISRIQATILVIKYCENARRFSNVFVLTAIAIRHAMALRLNYEQSNLPWITRETLRRTMWSLFAIDSHLAGGYSDFSLLSSQDIHIQLPCLEHNFALGTAEDVPRLGNALQSIKSSTGQTDLNTLAYVIQLRWLRHKVLTFTKSCVRNPDPNGVNVQVTALQEELDQFLANLPKNLRYSEGNLALHSYSPTFLAFATIHIVWHGVHCILYRLAAGGLKESLPLQILEAVGLERTTAYRHRGFAHAKRSAEIIAAITHSKPASAILDTDMAVSAYQCARMLFCLHETASPTLSLDELSVLVESCRQFLQEFFPSCEAIRCIVSKEVWRLLKTSVLVLRFR